MNPHAGEHELFGNEEKRFIAPAIEVACRQGILCSGPHAGDTVFLQASRGAYDLVVAMYHDQGHIPMKLIDFEGTVNISLGIPIIRTSVDHGTAFDIAGKNQADPRSMQQAIARGGAHGFDQAGRHNVVLNPRRRKPHRLRLAVAYCTRTVALSAMLADESPTMRLTGPVSTRKARSFTSQYASREAGRAISTVLVSLGCTVTRWNPLVVRAGARPSNPGASHRVGRLRRRCGCQCWSRQR